VATVIEDLVVRLQADASQFTAAMAGAVEQAQALGRHVMALGAGAVDSYKHFGGEMTKSLAIMDVTEDQAERMKRAALDMALVTARSPEQFAEAYYALASSGMKAEAAISALAAVHKFAAAGAMDVATATQNLVGAQAALGLKSADPAENLTNMMRVSDVVVRASKLAQGTTAQYAQALNRDAGAAMKTFNVTVEEGTAVLAAYGEQNITAALAGGTYGRLLRLMAAAASKNAAAHKELGLNVFNPDTGQLNNMADIMADLERIMGRLTPEERIPILKRLGFQVLSQRAITPLIGMSEKIREFQAALEGAGGFSAKVAAKQMGGFGAQLKMLKNVAEVARIEIGERLAPAFLIVAEYTASAAHAVRAAVPHVADWVERNREVLTEAAYAGAALFGLATAYGAARVAVTLAAAALYFLRVPQAITLALWLAWQGALLAVTLAVLAARGALLAYAALVAVFRGAVVLAVAKTLVWYSLTVTFTAALYAARAALALFAASMVVGNAVVAVMTFAWKALLAALGIGMAVVSTLTFLLAGAFKSLALAETAGAVGALLYKAALAGMAAVMAVVKVVAWALNAALTVTNLLVGGAALAAGVVVFLALAAAVVVAYAAAKALADSVIAVFDALSDTGALAGPLSHVGGLLGEWWETLKVVIDVARRDMPAAWGIMQAAFVLAFYQMRDLFPPLWAFLKEGFEALWDIVSATFAKSFRSSLGGVMAGLAAAPGPVGEAFKSAFSLWDTGNTQAIADAEKRVQEARDRLAAAGGKFKPVESDATKAARKELQGLVNVATGVRDTWFDLPDMSDEMYDWAATISDFEAQTGAPAGAWVMDVAADAGAAGRAFEQTGKQAKKMKEDLKVEATSFGSAEFVSRLAAYTAGVATPGTAAVDKADEQLGVLKEIRDAVRDQNDEGPGVEVEGVEGLD
jgi:TP901 family phage tail tape measure protein